MDQAASGHNSRAWPMRRSGLECRGTERFLNDRVFCTAKRCPASITGRTIVPGYESRGIFREDGGGCQTGCLLVRTDIVYHQGVSVTDV